MSYNCAMDPYPLQSADFNQLHPFYDALRAGNLTTTKCGSCGKVTWPPRTVCPVCTSDRLEWVDLPREGTIVGFTVQEAGLPGGFPPPIVFVLVELGGIRIMSRLVEADQAAVRLGAKVVPEALRVGGTPFTGEERVLPAFRLA